MAEWRGQGDRAAHFFSPGLFASRSLLFTRALPVVSLLTPVFCCSLFITSPAFMCISPKKGLARNCTNTQPRQLCFPGCLLWEASSLALRQCISQVSKQREDEPGRRAGTGERRERQTPQPRHSSLSSRRWKPQPGVISFERVLSRSTPHPHWLGFIW